MALVRPRLSDHYGIPLAQAKVSFAIPFLDEDIPLFLDPFLLWKSPSQQDQALHTAITNSFNHLGFLAKKGKETDALEMLIALSECDEIGLGLSRKRKGRRIGSGLAGDILHLFSRFPDYDKRGFLHFEEIQFFVEHFSKDRISDVACNLVKSFLIDYTMQECQQLSIPTSPANITVYNYRKHAFEEEKGVPLPINPVDNSAILFVPKRWLRFTPWLDIDDYFARICVQNSAPGRRAPNRVEVLAFNRNNYDLVQEYVLGRERTKQDCRNDPLFEQIPELSAKRSLAKIQKLPAGRGEGADKIYEEECAKLLASLLYPQLDFAQVQSRTDSGSHIRDLIFYNNRSHEFWADIYDRYGARQLVFELKNVVETDTEHVNQLNRYLRDEFGRFGILVTRNPLPKRIFRNTVDLWSAHRKCIVSLTDTDLEMMVQVYDSKQRDPGDVVKKKFVEFSRACPS